MKKFELGFLLLALIMTGCSGGNKNSGPGTTSNHTSAASTGTTGSSANRLCSLFTTTEINDFLGAPVGEGESAGPMNTACQWDGNSTGDEAIYAQIQVINDTRYWEKHTGAKGYEALHDIGKEAFVATSLGGWEAGTVTDKEVVFVSLSGGSASCERAVKFLRSTLERLGTSSK